MLTILNSREGDAATDENAAGQEDVTMMIQTEKSMNEKRVIGNPFQFAILLDDQGHEIAITEEMIQQACADLAKRCHYPTARKAA